MKKLRFVNSFVLSGIVTVIFIAVITISADLYLPLKDWLKNLFSHHWVGKSILSVIIFLIGGITFQFCPLNIGRTNNLGALNRNLQILFWITIIGIATIFGFFVFEFFK